MQADIESYRFCKLAVFGEYSVFDSVNCSEERLRLFRRAWGRCGVRLVGSSITARVPVLDPVVSGRPCQVLRFSTLFPYIHARPCWDSGLKNEGSKSPHFGGIVDWDEWASPSLGGAISGERSGCKFMVLGIRSVCGL